MEWPSPDVDGHIIARATTMASLARGRPWHRRLTARDVEFVREWGRRRRLARSADADMTLEQAEQLARTRDNFTCVLTGRRGVTTCAMLFWPGDALPAGYILPKRDLAFIAPCYVDINAAGDGALTHKFRCSTALGRSISHPANFLTVSAEFLRPIRDGHITFRPLDAGVSEILVDAKCPDRDRLRHALLASRDPSSDRFLLPVPSTKRKHSLWPDVARFGAHAALAPHIASIVRKNPQ